MEQFNEKPHYRITTFRGFGGLLALSFALWFLLIALLDYLLS